MIMHLQSLLFLTMVFISTGLADEPTAASPAGRSTFTENSIGMKLVLIPAGEFQMGNSETPDQLAIAYPQYDRERLTSLYDEAPVHKVQITRPFYLGMHEVTIGQFKKYLDLSGAVPESIADKTGGYGYNPQYDPKIRSEAMPLRDATQSTHGKIQDFHKATTIPY